MTLLAGARLGPYEVLSPLGAGGMGEVYRARDTRLGREVAVKVLPEELAGDPDRLRRFEGEARAASALSDPHIVTVFDIGIDGGVSYFATELVEGSDLRPLLDEPLPTRKAIELAEQIASGLAAAHEKGIVHRDLKPENILVARSGLAKIADFGLAKLTESGNSNVSELPTSDGHQTTAGVVMGTVGYMSPEQARGAVLDFRSDQFVFGSILYEMLTGKSAFRRGSPAETLSSILREDPPPLPATVPFPLRWIVERCLSKTPEGRYASTRDLAQDLAALGDHLSERNGAAEAPAIASRPLRRRWLPMSILAILLLVAADVALRLNRPRRSDARTLQFEIGIPGDSSLSVWRTPLALSPDGSRIVFETLGSLWLRPLDSLEARPLARTDGAIYPFWSADGRSIGFIRHGQLQILDLKADSVPQTLCAVPNPVTHGSWSRDGVILLGSLGQPISRIPSAGGRLTAVTRLDAARAETAHLFPHFLPDGLHFLFLARSIKPELSGIYVGSLNGGSPRRLLAGDTNAAFAPPGFLLFGREGTLLKQPFDAGGLTLTGEADPVVGKVSFDTGGQGGMAFSVSRTGVLAYALIVMPPSQLEWLDRTGRKLGVVGAPGLHFDVDLAPDGRRAVVETMDPATGHGDLWIHELERGISSRFSHDPTWSFHPLWSPDGKNIVFSSTRAGGITTLFVKSTVGDRDEAPVSGSFIPGWPSGFSHDGRNLVFMKGSSSAGLDIFQVPLAGHHEPTPFLATEFSESQGTLSHDDRWIAYTSDESGRREVYVRPYPTGDGKWQISVDGGSEPRWRADGRELFFLSPDGHLMAAEIPENAAFDKVRPVPLFATHARRHILRNDYGVSADGSRFLVNNVLPGEARTRIVVVLNWQKTQAP